MRSISRLNQTTETALASKKIKLSTSKRTSFSRKEIDKTKSVEDTVSLRILTQKTWTMKECQRLLKFTKALRRGTVPSQVQLN